MTEETEDPAAIEQEDESKPANPVEIPAEPVEPPTDEEEEDVPDEAFLDPDAADSDDTIDNAEAEEQPRDDVERTDD